MQGLLQLLQGCPLLWSLMPFQEGLKHGAFELEVHPAPEFVPIPLGEEKLSRLLFPGFRAKRTESLAKIFLERAALERLLWVAEAIRMESAHHERKDHESGGELHLVEGAGGFEQLGMVEKFGRGVVREMGVVDVGNAIPSGDLETVAVDEAYLALLVYQEVGGIEVADKDALGG